MNGVAYGQRSTLGVRDQDLYINIEDQIVKYPDYRRELIKRLSGKNFKNKVKSHKYEWSAKDRRALQTTVSVGAAADGNTIVLSEPGVMQVDEVFQDANGLQYVVTSVGGGVNVTFSHISESGTRQAITSGDTVTVVGGATAQGKNADSGLYRPFEDFFNYTSILEDVVDLSGTDHTSMIRGQEGSGALIADVQKQLVEKLQRQLIVGVRHRDGANKRTAMGGMKFMIDTYAANNVIDFGGASTWATDTAVQDKIDDALDIISEKAFEKPVMYVGPKFMRKFKYIQDDTTRTSLTEKTRGIGVVKKYQSHLFGDIDVVQLHGLGGVMDDLVFLVDESTIGYKAKEKRGWQTSPLAKLGDSYRWQVLGEYTFKMDIPEAGVYLHNLGV